MPNTLQISELAEIIHGPWEGRNPRSISERSMAAFIEYTSDNRLSVRRGSERTPCFMAQCPLSLSIGHVFIIVGRNNGLD